MKINIVCLFVLFFACVFSESTAPPTPPVWPSQYVAKGVFQIPYWNLNMPLSVEYDGIGNREKLSYYNGANNYTYRFDLGVMYEVVPRVNKLTCFVPQVGNGPMINVLPDLSTWNWLGRAPCSAGVCNRWETRVTNFSRTNIYDFLEYNGTPIALTMYGRNFIQQSHPDIYILDFNYFSTVLDLHTFDQPSLCQTAEKLEPEVETRMVHRAKQWLGQLSALTPQSMNDEFEAFVVTHKKYHFSHEVDSRRNIFAQNKKFIEDHNKKPNKTFTMAINKFADLEQSEVATLMRPKPQGPKPAHKATGTLKKSHKTLPDSVNWIQQGAVTPIKDQGICGSCWTFGTTGTIEGAFFIQTGQLLSLSEQQILDCAWVNWGGAGGNLGCDGGYTSAALDWIMKNGGIALESSYPYLMQNSYCNSTDRSSGVIVSGYLNVTSGDEGALQDAVANSGPTAVAIDASQPSFTFYSDGVYYDANCKNDVDDLDHEVLAVGYGTEAGQDYWLVKNSWSIFWGDEGYIKMSRNRGNNCGIATQPTVASAA